MRAFTPFVILLSLGGGNTSFVFDNPKNTAPGTQHFLLGWAVDKSVYQIGTKLNATWTTDWLSYKIYVSQQFADLTLYGWSGSFDNLHVFTKNPRDVEPHGFKWDVGIGSFSISTPNIFFFTAVDSDGIPTYSIFNITENAVTNKSASAVTTTTSSSSSATGTTSSTATTSPTISNSSAITSAKSSSSNTSPASNNNLAIGLGVGVGVGFLATGSLLAVLLFKVFRAKKTSVVPGDDQYFQLNAPISNDQQSRDASVGTRMSPDGELPASPVAVRTINLRQYELHG